MEKLTTYILDSDRYSGGPSKCSLALKNNPLLYRLDEMAEDIAREETPTLQPELAGLIRYP